jgi:hypothetical protein
MKIKYHIYGAQLNNYEREINNIKCIIRKEKKS